MAVQQPRTYGAQQQAPQKQFYATQPQGQATPQFSVLAGTGGMRMPSQQNPPMDRVYRPPTQQNQNAWQQSNQNMMNFAQQQNDFNQYQFGGAQNQQATSKGRASRAGTSTGGQGGQVQSSMYMPSVQSGGGNYGGTNTGNNSYVGPPQGTAYNPDAGGNNSYVQGYAPPRPPGQATQQQQQNQYNSYGGTQPPPYTPLQAKQFAPPTYQQTYGGAFNVGNFADKNSDWARYIENTLPVAQMQSNDYWNSLNFNNNTSQWAADFGETVYGNRFNQGLQSDYLGMAQQGQAHGQNMDIKTFDQNVLNDLRNYGLGQGHLGVAQQGAGTNQFNAQTQRDVGMGQLGINQQLANTGQFNAQTQRDIGTAANEIDRMWKEGQLTNQQAQLAFQQLQHGDTFGLAQQSQDWRQGFDERTLTEKSALEREQMRNQMAMATMQATGRQAAPGSRWQRNW